MYSARYLGVGMRYEDGICTIVISTTEAFKWCPFCCRLNFNSKLWKTMDYSLCSSAIFGKNMTDIKIHFLDIVWKVFHADHNGTVPLASYMYLIHVSRYDVSYIWQWIHDHFKYASLQVHCPNSAASYHVHVHTFYTRWIWNWCTHVQWKGDSGIIIISS